MILTTSRYCCSLVVAALVGIAIDHFSFLYILERSDDEVVDISLAGLTLKVDIVFLCKRLELCRGVRQKLFLDVCNGVLIATLVLTAISGVLVRIVCVLSRASSGRGRRLGRRLVVREHLTAQLLKLRNVLVFHVEYGMGGMPHLSVLDAVVKFYSCHIVVLPESHQYLMLKTVFMLSKEGRTISDTQLMMLTGRAIF
nr:MAG TPA: hypothetical protein [Caudoviricetes sp.]